jgi:hypothetical protein
MDETFYQFSKLRNKIPRRMLLRPSQYTFIPSCINTAVAFELPSDEVEWWKKLRR